MPNVIKYSLSAQTEALKKGNFWIGTGDVGKGPTSSSDYWQGITPPTGGYTIYLNKASQGPSIYAPTNDDSLITLTNMIGSQSFTSVTQCFNWYNTQSDKMVFNKDYPAIITSGLVLNLDATFLPSYSTSGTTWYDLSPSGNNGTLTNGPTYSSSQGGSIVFDGTDDYVNVGMSNFPSGSSSRTLSAIFRVTSVSGGKELFGFGQNTGIGSRYALWIDGSNRIGIEFVGAAVTTSSWAGINNWIHLTAVLPSTNGFSTLIYVNGIQRSTTTGGSDGTINTPSAANGGVCYVGAVPGALVGFPHIFPGNVANVLVYNRALSSAEILQNFYGSNIVTSGLVLYLDAGNIVSYPQTGTAWYDISSGGNNMTLTNGPTYSSISGGVIVFDGTDDYTQSTMSVNSIVNVTIECWVNISSTSNKGAFVKVGGGVNGYSIGVGSNTMDTLGNEVIGLFPGIRWIDTNQTYGTGWKMVNLVLNASSVPSIYLNGTLLNSYSGANPVTPTAGVYIGRNIGDEPSGARAFSGNISIVRIYNRALSATEISSNYNAQKSRFGL